MTKFSPSNESHELISPFNLLNKAIVDKKWYCGPETDSTPVFFGDPTTLTEEQLELSRFYPRLQKRHFPYGISSTLIGLWNTMGALQGRYSQNPDFSFKKNLLSPIVLKYPDDFPTESEFIFFTNEFYSALGTMNAHGGKLNEWTKMRFDPSLDNINLSHPNFPTINLESIWWHERRHSQKKYEMGYPSGGYFYLGLDILTRQGSSVELSNSAAYSLVPNNVLLEHRCISATAPLFPGDHDWERALRFDRELALQEFKNKPWFNLIASEFRTNIDRLTPKRVAEIGGKVQSQLLKPNIFGSNYIDLSRLSQYKIERPDSSLYKDYIPPLSQYKN